MDQTDIIKYFNEYIKTYSSYTNNSTFRSLTDYLGYNYTEEVYQNIPYIFKKLYEENKIPNELYDIILQNIGIPKDVLVSLSKLDKMTFFNNFTDYYRFRGNLEFFDKISKLNRFNEFDVYELYIDYHNDFYTEDWVFKPNKIINNIDSEYDFYLDYNSVYNSVPNFLINKSQLNHYKDTNNLVLPVKSNLILLNYLFLSKLDGLSNFIFSTFLKEYQNNFFTLYFRDKQFTVSLKSFVIIWVYLFLKLYDDTSFSEISNIFKCILYLNSDNPYNIDDLENIINEYNELSNMYDAYQFYNQYLETHFSRNTIFYKFTENELKNYIDIDIIEYLDLRISSFEEDVDEIDIHNILFDELLNSFDVYLNSVVDENFLKYSDEFLNSLTKLIVNPQNTGSYKLLNHYKPFHVDFITDYSARIICDSKFEMVKPLSKYKFKVQFNSVDNLNLLDYNINRIKLSNIDIININDPVSFKLNKNINTTINIDDTNILFNLSQINFDVNNLIDYINLHTNIIQNNILNITDVNSFNLNKTLSNEISINDLQGSISFHQFNNDTNNLVENNYFYTNIINNDTNNLVENNYFYTNIINNDDNLFSDQFSIIHLLPNIQYNLHSPNIIELYCNYSNYEIYYTLNGSNPTINSLLYDGFINYTSPIRAIAYNDLDNSYSNILIITYEDLTIETEYLNI